MRTLLNAAMRAALYAVVMVGSLAWASDALASHFRGAHITWQRVSGTTVEFTVRHAWRVSPSPIAMGDGTFRPPGTLVSSPVDLAGAPYGVYETTFQHTYPHNGPFNVGFSSCCRIFGLQNASSSSFRVWTVVDLNTANQGSSVSSLPAILQMPVGPSISVPLAKADPDGTPVCRMATSSESLIPSIANVAGVPLTVTPDCELQWNTSTAPHGSRYAAQVMFEQGGLKTPLDFIIEINAGLVNNDPPSCTLNGPAANSVSIGTPFSITMDGVDPEGGNLTVNAQGLPPGATLTPPDGSVVGSPVTATFDWTPTTALTAGVTVTFTDNGNQQAQCSFTVESTNSAPTADAGPDQSVDEGTTVNLDGTASSDSDGDPLTYSWVQIGVPAVTLSDPSSATPSFMAPYLSANATLTFELTVSDGIESDSDLVEIAVENSNTPPIADAGADSTVKEGGATQLDGTGSYDPDAGDSIVSYQWTQPGGPSVVLAPDSTSPQPTFGTSFGDAGSFLTFKLVVSDGKEPSTADEVVIEVVANSQPVADAGPDDTKDEGTTVTLDGSLSYDPDLGDTLSYAWTQVGGPTVTLSDANAINPSFDAPPVSATTAFTFELVVTDDDPFNQLSSDPDTVVINVRSINEPPSCELAMADPARLWPPNHKLEDVTIEGVMDEDSMYNNVTLVVTGVTQDEAVNGLGDGDSSPDAVIQIGDPADSVAIRRERAGGENGRVYRVDFLASDGFEDCTGSVTITVPHDRRGTDAIDDGQTVDSTSAG